MALPLMRSSNWQKLKLDIFHEVPKNMNYLIILETRGWRNLSEEKI